MKITKFKRSSEVLGEDNINIIGTNLAYFWYSKDVTENLEVLSKYLSQEAINDLKAERDYYKDKREFEQGDIDENLVIQGISCIKEDDFYIIFVDYMEESLRHEKMTTIIRLKMREGIVSEIQTWDLLNNVPYSSNRM